MEKMVKSYTRPQVKVNNFISRNYLMGWEIGEGTTNQQLGHNPGPDELVLPEIDGKHNNNVWEDE